MSNTFEFTDRLGFNPPENSIGSGFPQFPMPFDFTTLNVSQLANKYYGNNAVLEKKGLKVYADQDTENLFNNGDPETLEEVIVYSNKSYMEFKDFDLSLFTSTNGVTLLQQFKEVEVSSDEVVIFLEIDNPTNFFGTVMRIKVGSNLKGRKDLPYSEIIDFAQDKGISVSPNRIKRLLKKGVKSKKNLFKWVLSSIAKTIGKAVEFVSGEVGDLFFQTIPDAIDKIRISENRWNPSLEGYNGIFIPDKFENYIANLKDDEKGENSILKAFVKPFFKQVNSLESFTKGKLKTVKSYIPGKVYRKLKKAIDYLFGKINGLEDLIYDSEYGLFKLILTALEAANSFLCGLYNSIIDTIKGIFQIVGLVFKGIEAAADFTSNLGYYASLSVEFIENIIEGILEIDFVELFKQLFFLPLVILKKVVSFTVNQSALSIQEFYYYIGYIVGFIVETVVSILFTGGSLSVGKVLAKTFKEPVEFLLKGFKGIVSVSKSLVNKVISAVQYIIKKLKNPKQLAADFLKFIEDLFGAGKKNSKNIDELAESKKIRKHLINDVPGIKGFSKWFDDLTLKEFELVWENITLRNKIKARLRHPGGLHEWLMVSRANVFKKWKISANEIKKLRTKIEEVVFVNPDGIHGGPGSTKAHNEILKIIDNSNDYDEFVGELIKWSNKRLKGGSKKLPKGFFE